MRKLKSQPYDVPVPLPPEAWPLMVTFDDITDPTIVRQIDPNDLVASFGPGVKLKAVRLELTRAPITNRINTVLAWVDDPVLKSNPTWASLPYFVQHVLTSLKTPEEGYVP